MIGGHLIKAWSTTQTVVALSSAEAELTGLAKGAAQAMGLRSCAKDLGMSWDICLHSDASAAILICRRKGLGKVRHLATADLWIQDKLKEKDFRLDNILGTEHPADLLTKYLDAAAQNQHISRLRLVEESGRAALAPALPKGDGG